MTEEQKQNVKHKFDQMSNRDKLALLAKLSQPWIKHGAITHPANTLEEIFQLMDRSKAVEPQAKKVREKVQPLLDRAANFSRFTRKKPKRRK